MRLEVNVLQLDSEAKETFLVPVSQGMTVLDLRHKIQHRARKLDGWQQCEVLKLRQGSVSGGLLDDEDEVQGLLAPEDRLFAQLAAPAARAAADDDVEMAAPSAGDLPLQGEAAAPEVRMVADGEGKVAVKYQTIERLAGGQPPGEVMVDAKLCTLDLAKQIADVEGMKYSNANAEDSSSAAPFGSCRGTGCVCSTANARLKIWGYDAALKIEPKAFLEKGHPQRWAADLCPAGDLCPICLMPLSDHSGDVVVGNRECFHFFHSECLLKFLQRDGKRQCPVCRGDWHFLEAREARGTPPLLVLLQPSGEAMCIDLDIRPGMTAKEVKSMATAVSGVDCGRLLLHSHGVTLDEEATVVHQVPPIYSLCERGAHPWSMQVECNGPDGQKVQRKMRSSDTILDLKRSLHRHWKMLPSKLRIHDHAGIFLADAVMLGELHEGVRIEAEVTVSVSDESFVFLDLWVPSHRLSRPSTEDTCEDVLLEGDVLYVTQRCSFQGPEKNAPPPGLLGMGSDRMTLFAADEAWQVVNRPQTEDGLSCLLSSLYILARQPESTKQALLSSLWRLLPFPPLQLAVALLLEGRGKQIQAPEKAAVAHGVFQLINAMAPKDLPADQLFEHSRILLSYLIQSAGEIEMPNQVEQRLLCSITGQQLQEPVFFADRPETFFNRSAAAHVFAQLAAGELEMQLDEAYWRSRTEQDLQEAQHMVRLVKTFSPLTDCLVLSVKPSSGETVALSARSGVPASSGPFSACGFPSWTQLRVACGKDDKTSCLRLMGALSLKTCHSPPKLTRTKEGQVVVFTGNGKSTAGNCVIFSPLLGSEEHIDLDQVAKALAHLDTDHHGRDDRELQEGVIICLDTSNSMLSKSSFSDQAEAEAEASMWALGPPQEDSEEMLNALIRRFHHHPGIYYLRQCRAKMRGRVQEKGQMILEQLCQLLRGNGRISEDHLRIMAKHSEKFLAILKPHQGEVPYEFCCPITQNIMEDAVCAADGFTYERSAIEEWFTRSSRSPMTRQSISRSLVQNHALRSQIQDFQASHHGVREVERPMEVDGPFYLDCWMPRSCSEWCMKMKAKKNTTGLDLKRLLSNCLGQPQETLRLFHGDHLLPDLCTLSSLGLVDGSPITVAFTGFLGHLPLWALSSASSCLGRHIKVMIDEFECTVAAWEMIIALKCRYWSQLPQRKQLALPLGDMSLWGKTRDAGDGYFTGTLLRDDCCIGDFLEEDTSVDDELPSLQLKVRSGAAAQRSSQKRMSRLDVVKQLFNAYVDRSLAYDYPCAIGLVCFGSEVTERCKLTAAYESFRDRVKDVTPDGDTRLFDALHLAGSRLKKWQEEQMSKPNRTLGVPKLRIVALSDGKDTLSEKTAKEVAGFLSQSNIVVDSVLIGTETDSRLHQISKASGGYVFQPLSLKDAVRLNELEVFLSCHERPEPDVADLDRWDALGPRHCPVDSCSEDHVPPQKQPKELRNVVHGLEDALRDGAASASANASAQGTTAAANSQRQQRILAEMQQLHRKPHPAVDIFPSCGDVGFWQATMSGPDGTAYAGGVWKLYVQFPSDYPVDPPELRFVTPIKHCNINQHGKVCHSILARNWTRDTSMQVVLQNVYGLLLEPDVEDPLDSTLALAFYDDSGLYETSIVEHVARHAKSRSRAEWFQLLSAPEEQSEDVEPPTKRAKKK